MTSANSICSKRGGKLVNELVADYNLVHFRIIVGVSLVAV